MKGPYERLKYDLRRVFECPHCRHRVRMPGQVASAWCECALPEGQRRHCMTLVEDGTRRIDGRKLPRPGTAVPP